MNYGAVKLDEIEDGEDYAVKLDQGVVRVRVRQSWNTYPNGRKRREFEVQCFTDNGRADGQVVHIYLEKFVAPWAEYVAHQESAERYQAARRELTNLLTDLGIPFEMKPSPRTLVPEHVVVTYSVEHIMAKARERSVAVDLQEILRGLEAPT